MTSDYKDCDERVINGVLSWRDQNGEWHPLTAEFLTALVMELRRKPAIMPFTIPYQYYPPITYPNQPPYSPYPFITC